MVVVGRTVVVVATGGRVVTVVSGRVVGVVTVVAGASVVDTGGGPTTGA